MLVAYAIARGGYTLGFGVLIVPALMTLGCLAVANVAGRNLVPAAQGGTESPIRDAAAFRRYAIGGALVAAGYVDFALIAFRLSRDHVVGVPAISVWFAVAMAVGAIAAPILGRLYDRRGKAAIVAAIALSAAATPLAFLGRGPAAEAGAALWGVGIAVQDALLLALVSSALAEHRRATAFGLYDLIFGSAWFVGSAICGILLDRSTIGLAIFSTVLQLAAIPFFTIGRRPAIEKSS